MFTLTKELFEEMTSRFAILRQFVSDSQRRALSQALREEEAEFFINKVRELSDTFRSMPKTYETDGQGGEAVVYLHYFKNGCDWFIVERDKEDYQHQAFGYVNMGHGFECGYISLLELIENDVEIDLYWTPKKVKDIL